MSRNPEIRALETRYASVRFRSRVEARWGLALDAMGLGWDYEPQGFAIRGGGYLPDFLIRDWQVFLEIKGADPTDEERAKSAELAYKAQRVVLLAVGSPEERFQIRYFGPEGESDQLFALAHDRYADGGFWLVSEDGARSLGPYGLRAGGPCFWTLEQAFEAARTERFEGDYARRRYPAIPFPADAHQWFVKPTDRPCPASVSAALWAMTMKRQDSAA